MKKDSFFKRFLPVYDELSLFLMGLAYIILLIIGRGRPFTLYLFIGAIFAIFYGFSTKKKPDFAKKILLMFAIAITGIAALFSAIYIMDYNQPNIFWIFPIINLIQAGIFIILYRFKVIDIEQISDEDIPLKTIVVSGIILLCILLLCTFLLHLYWAITFSIAVGVIVSFEKSIREIFRV